MAMLATLMGQPSNVPYITNPTSSSNQYPTIQDTAITADQSITLYAFGHNGGNPVPAYCSWTFNKVPTSGPDTVLTEVPISNVTASNRLPSSTSMSAWTLNFLNSSATIAENAANGPDGSVNTAIELIFPGPWTGAGAYADIEFRSLDGQHYSGDSQAFSFWARTSSGNFPISIIESDWPYNGNAGGLETVTITPTWQRFVLTGINTAIGAPFNSSRPIIRAYGTTPGSIFVWGFQQEINVGMSPPLPGPYVPTTSAPAAGQGALNAYEITSGGVGTHTYQASLNTPGGSSVLTNSLTYTVTKASPVLSLVPMTGAVAGKPGSVQVNNNPCYNPSGTFTVSINGTTVSTPTVALASSFGSASFVADFTNVAAGSHTISVSYPGDSNNNGTSASIAYTIGETSPTLALTTPAASVVLGSTAAITATLTGGFTPTGSVTFYENGVSAAVVSLTSGVAVWNFATIGPPGAYTLTAVYSGDGNNGIATATAITLTQTQVVPTLALSSTIPSPALAGAAFTLTAVMTGDYLSESSGVVTFSTGTTVLGSTTIVGNSASISVTLPAGLYTVTASYGGDVYNAPTSTSSTVTVSQRTVGTSLTASPSSITVGTTVTLTATVTGGDNPIGSVHFYDGVTLIGTATLSLNQAILSISTLLPGSHSILAAYSGDGNDAPVSFSAVTEVVIKATPTISIASPGNTAIGEPITIQATIVEGFNATGTITFSGPDVGSTTISLVNSQASFTTSLSFVGTETVTCVYSGDANNNTVTITTTFTSVLAAPNLVLQTNLTVVTAGQSVTLVALPAGGFAATGTVTFFEDGAQIAIIPVASGVAVLVTDPLLAGSHVFEANYSGDSRNSSATGTVAVQVNVATPTLTITLSDTAFTAGAGVVVTATLTGGYDPTGTVQFFLDGVSFGTSDVVNQFATMNSPLLSAGSHVLTALYSGDQDNTEASASAITITVELAPSVVLDPLFPNRIELRLGIYQGPLSIPSTEAGFTPASDLRIFVDGILMPVQSAVFDSGVNRYLMYTTQPIATTSLVQVTHHMPNPPFKTANSVTFPGFTRTAIVSDATDLVLATLLNLGELGTLGGGFGICPFGAIGLFIDGVFQGLETV
jgi:hypothetical protein